MLYTMFPELVVIGYLASRARVRLEAVRADERGYTTEGVIMTAILALLAIGAAGIITTKVLAKANGIETE
jgi:hypothetical protein